jgi:hypothetical protein
MIADVVVNEVYVQTRRISADAVITALPHTSTIARANFSDRRRSSHKKHKNTKANQKFIL